MKKIDQIENHNISSFVLKLSKLLQVFYLLFRIPILEISYAGVPRAMQFLSTAMIRCFKECWLNTLIVPKFPHLYGNSICMVSRKYLKKVLK